MACDDRCKRVGRRTYHVHACWPVGDTACRVDPMDLDNIDPLDGGPTREEAMRRLENRNLF